MVIWNYKERVIYSHRWQESSMKLKEGNKEASYNVKLAVSLDWVIHLRIIPVQIHDQCVVYRHIAGLVLKYHALKVDDSVGNDESLAVGPTLISDVV